MSGPWSKLKSRVEELWVPKLGLQIYCTVYYRSHPGGSKPNRGSRHWITLNQEILWDFPTAFLRDPPGRGRLGPGNLSFPNGGKLIGNLLRDYLDREKDRLFEPFEEDGWELTDILRAADRRLGRQALLEWSKPFDDEHPALAVLAARFPVKTRSAAQSASSPQNPGLE